MPTPKILIATWPFGSTGKEPLTLLMETGWELLLNPHHRRLTASEISDLLMDVDAVIAGTEPYNAGTLKKASRLQLINRVGIGLDNVDLDFCRKNNIRVTFTPDAPSQAVAELTIANILNLIRHIHQSDRSVREGAWNRLMGKLLREITIGIVGVGRIGSQVIRLLEPFQPTILDFDSNPNIQGTPMPNTTWTSLEEIRSAADLLSVHIPLNQENRHLLSREFLGHMKRGSFLINTSRGGILDTAALTEALLDGHLGGAALDVYEQEPYEGELIKMDNCILTAHIGASAAQSRYLMELGAAQDCIRILTGQPPKHDAFCELQAIPHCEKIIAIPNRTHKNAKSFKKKVYR